MADSNEFLFEGEPEHCSLCGEPGHTHDDHWLFQYDVVKALQASRDDWHKLADERSAELTNVIDENKQAARAIAELEAELRKFVPSDGVMHQLLDYTLTIREAANAFESIQAGWPRVYGLHVVIIENWLALPVVVAARKGAGNG